MTIKNFRRDYLEEQMYFYGKNGRVKKGKSGSSTRCIEPIDAMVRFYANESPITKAWCDKADFDAKVKEAKAFKKVINKKARAEALRLLNK